ncbi:ABC transporter ATP-binding protein [Psychrilyobacter atlanticus]|uniref:ABC transporter ATP-binding protein n=1 Tax=Psychrilyobacter atlanticus TaxID=271091 RepID=UPI00041DAE75|nr:ABC transporter ATP-binding protein [Psychrilyobacter atlanticus]
MKKILEIDDLKFYFRLEEDKSIVKAVDGVSFDMYEGETLGIVGESGSGKSVTTMAIMGIVPMPPGFVEGGEIRFQGDNLFSMDPDKLRNMRGSDMSVIFQEPMTSLNPVLTIGDQLTEVLFFHQKLSKKDAKAKAIGMLEKVGIAGPERVYNGYPHNLSGGQRQRVVIAMALLCEPKLLIADEPTTALDVTIQAEILKLLKDIKEEFKTSTIFITHDLGVIAEVADRVVVMYRGRVMEIATIDDLFDNPIHPYTVGLMNSMPSIDTDSDELYSMPEKIGHPIAIDRGGNYEITDEIYYEDDTQMITLENRELRVHLKKEVD